MSRDRFRIEDYIIPGQHIREYPGATTTTQEDVLQLHIKRYTPLRANQHSNDNAITVIGAHANGFPKELYEPLWDELLERSTGRFVIRGIWIADVAHQGRSYILNERMISNDPSWYDHSRDLLNVINHFRSEMPRPLIGIGVNLSLMHPRLFSTIVLLDPVIESGPATGSTSGGNAFGIARSSTYRRDIWNSREEALATFSRNPFYKRWDKRVIEQFIHYGLRELPTLLYPYHGKQNVVGKAVTLTTTKHQEVWTYLRPNFGGKDERGIEKWRRHLTPDIAPGSPHTYPFYRIESSVVYSKLPYIRPWVLYILGGNSNLSIPELQRNKVTLTGIGIGGNGGISEGHVRDVILPGIGHLVPFEAPDASAQETVNWIAEFMVHWIGEEGKWRENRRTRSKTDDMKVDNAWYA